MQTDYVRFIGTGSAQSSKDRFHSAFVFSSSGKLCLVDTGDGISKALLTQGFDYGDIESIIISHMHPDHYSGLAGLLIQMKLIKRTKELSVFVHESLIDTINGILDVSYLFRDRLGFSFHLSGYNGDEFFHPLDKLEVLARQNSHLDDYIKDSPGGISFSCSSYLFNFSNKTIFYTGDIGSEEDLYLFNDFNFDIFITEVTHVDPVKIIEVFQSSGAEKLYLTHISSGDDQKLNALIQSFNNVSGKKIVIAADGQKISF